MTKGFNHRLPLDFDDLNEIIKCKEIDLLTSLDPMVTHLPIFNYGNKPMNFWMENMGINLYIELEN